MEIPRHRTMRISEDIWYIAIEHAQTEGLSTPRDAVERMVRLFVKEAASQSAHVEA